MVCDGGDFCDLGCSGGGGGMGNVIYYDFIILNLCVI